MRRWGRVAGDTNGGQGCAAGGGPDGGPRAGGRALVVKMVFSDGRAEAGPLARAALAMAVERAHMVWLGALDGHDAPAMARATEDVLIGASRKGQLLDARGMAYGWGADAMAQLSVATLTGPELETAATMVGGGDLQLWNAEWADVSILANPREVKLNGCSGVEDLSPVADVRGPVVSGCHGTRALPAMRNDVLEVGECKALTDVSGLGGGRVGRLELRHLLSAENVGSIGAMQVPLRTVVVEGMHTVQDVSMVAGVCGLEVIGCPRLDGEATLAGLEGGVGRIRWRGQA